MSDLYFSSIREICELIACSASLVSGASFFFLSFLLPKSFFIFYIFLVNSGRHLILIHLPKLLLPTLSLPHHPSYFPYLRPSSISCLQALPHAEDALRLSLKRILILLGFEQNLLINGKLGERGEISRRVVKWQPFQSWSTCRRQGTQLRSEMSDLFAYSWRSTWLQSLWDFLLHEMHNQMAFSPRWSLSTMQADSWDNALSQNSQKSSLLFALPMSEPWQRLHC